MAGPWTAWPIGWPTGQRVTLKPSASSSSNGRLGHQADPARTSRVRKEHIMKPRNVVLTALPLLAPLLLLTASANASALETGNATFTATGEIVSVMHSAG